jgi:uncharacterized protein YkwD
MSVRGEESGEILRVMKLPWLRPPVLISFAFLVLGIGWVGWMQAARFSSPQGVSPISANTSLDLGGDSSEKKAYLGVRGKRFHQGEVRGVKIVEVFSGSPAAKAGLRSDQDAAPAYLRQSGEATGHIIVGASGQGIRSEEDLGGLLAFSPPGGVVKFLVTSNGGSFYEVIPVTLGTAPEESSGVEAVAGKGAQSPSLQQETARRGMEEEIFQEVNRAREKKGLSPLRENPQLRRLARRHSRDMATRNFFSHLSPDGHHVVDRLRAGGVEDFTAVGENIFTGGQVADLARVAVQEWRKSPGHRQNLFNLRYAEAGVGIAWGEGEMVYVTQVFLER